MKYITLIVISTTFLFGCALSTPPQSLSEKLEGKAPEDRKEILRLACLNEAEWPIYHSTYYARSNTKVRQRLKQSYNPEVSEMKALCRKMDALTDPKTEETLSPKELASMCNEKIAVTAKKQQDGASKHATRLQRICEEMTEEIVGTDKK